MQCHKILLSIPWKFSFVILNVCKKVKANTSGCWPLILSMTLHLKYCVFFCVFFLLSSQLCSQISNVCFESLLISQLRKWSGFRGKEGEGEVDSKLKHTFFIQFFSYFMLLLTIIVHFFTIFMSDFKRFLWQIAQIYGRMFSNSWRRKRTLKIVGSHLGWDTWA